MPGGVNVQFIVLPSPFDGTQRPVYGGITSNVIMNYHLDPGSVGASRGDNRDEEVLTFQQGTNKTHYTSVLFVEEKPVNPPC